MSIWKHKADLATLNRLMDGTMCDYLGMEITEIGEEHLTATMPVDRRTVQHMGIVHGGGSVALAETVGSIAAGLCCPPGYFCVGLDINANHVRPGRPPYLTAVARPLHVGSSTSVWDIRITDTEDKLVCVSRLTMAVLKQEAAGE